MGSKVLLITAGTLRPIANALSYLGTNVHPVYFPYPWARTLHALRVSYVFQASARRFNGPQGAKALSWGTYISGFLVMAWGGTVLSSLLLSQPPPMLYSVGIWINYIVPHLILTFLFSTSFLSPSLLTTNSHLVDTILFPLDGLLRAGSVAGTLALLSNPSSPVNPLLASSPLTHLILGAIASGGGGTTAATINAWNPQWSFNTPVFLRDGVGWLGTLDLWGGALAAIIYSSLTSHPAFTPFTHGFLSYMAVLPFTPDLLPSLSALGAKAVAALVFMILFATRVYLRHWAGGLWPRSTPQTGRKLGAVPSQGQKTKTQ
ncbi:hypothetical protein BDN72DRAFT_965489 [Pluteus cervinus]|uniref:Uncharacterized protein n=1 Tax=Pluteus cervinus TaxID=181527 RepID=A0ACD3A4V4_9AGAR|nr:hypothetical protein BDN72DRAFT_965489 [Pluteus cervinus]